MNIFIEGKRYDLRDYDYIISRIISKHKSDLRKENIRIYLMGAAKGDYTTRLNDKPQDTIAGLRRKITELEQEIEDLKTKYKLLN